MSNYNWQAAFVSFCNGVPYEEIAAIFGIPLDTLQGKISNEGWKGLRSKLPLVTMTEGALTSAASAESSLPATVATKLALVEANRAENLKVFALLREHLMTQVTELQAGRLKVERLFNYQGAITHAESDPSPGDWVNIATYARTIADGTYRALGDFQGQEKASQDATAGTVNAPQPSITIILPAAIAQPRAERQIIEAKQGQVIDLTPVESDSAPACGAK